MKIAIATVRVPFIEGGAEIHAALLKNELLKRGHECDIISIPFKWYPAQTMLDCMVTGRMIDLTETNGEKIDLVIAMKFPAYYLKHPNKVLWLLHQHRQAYDLWGTEHDDLQNVPEGRFIRDTIIKHDNLYIPEAKRIFTNSKNTAQRLKKYNDLDAVPLYHPPADSERLHCEEYGNFIFYPSRINAMKRQRVLVEAARYLKSDTLLYIAGNDKNKEGDYLRELIETYNLQNKVRLLGYISDEEKIDYYARCLGVYFGAYDEDYGYITLESFLSRKPAIIHHDAGGPLEFVTHRQNGLVVEDAPQVVAQAIDQLANDKAQAKSFGENGYQSLAEKNINWDYVINQLLGEGFLHEQS